MVTSVSLAAPQSGKSTLLRTLITGLALTHTPREVQFYCLDFGGGTLSTLRGLPHLGGVTGRHDGERVLRTIAEVNGVITRREKYFAELGIDSISNFRRRKAAYQLAEDPHGDVFLVIDGWNTLRQEFNDLAQVLTLIAQRGINYGVHLMVATTRWGEVTAGLRDLLQTRFELRLGDAVDSVINMRAAAKVPKSPGRGMTEEQLHFLTALPRIDGTGTTEDLGEGIADLVDAIAAHWTGPRAPRCGCCRSPWTPPTCRRPRDACGYRSAWRTPRSHRSGTTSRRARTCWWSATPSPARPTC